MSDFEEGEFMSDPFDAEACCDCGGLGPDSGGACMRCGSARHGMLIRELSWQLERMRKHLGPGSYHKEALVTLRTSSDGVDADEAGSESARTKSAACIVAAANLLIAHGGDIGDELAKAVERVSSHLDAIEAGDVREQRLSRLLSEISEFDPRGEETQRLQRAIGLNEEGGTPR